MASHSQRDTELIDVSVYEREVNRLLDGLGPRFIDWWWPKPLPVDADLLPAIVPGFKTPFRLCPPNEWKRLSNDDLTNRRKLARLLPTHFALSKNTKLQGLACAIMKLWEKSLIAKIAIKVGVQNTNSQQMAWALKEAKPSSCLQLIFKKPPSLPIFTENKIEDDDGFPLEILLTDPATVRPLAAFLSSIKVEIVVLDGDFPYENSDNYSSSDFNRHIVKERRGRRPLLTGDTVVTLKDGSASIDELKFTDNSSWIRSRNFRLGVRVLPENQEGLNIREAVIGPFMVKDHRGETYKKHYPPLLGDEVWRLEKIGKDGVFHKRLMAENINTVQDFLKLSVMDSARLQKILGMSNSYWVAAVSHARTCPLGGKLYVYHAPHYAIVLNPICEIVNIEVDGVSWTFQKLSLPLRATVQNVISEAYNSWDSFEEISLPLATGELVNQVVLEPHPIEGYFEVGLIQNEEQMGVYNSTQVMPNILFEEYEYNGDEN